MPTKLSKLIKLRKQQINPAKWSNYLGWYACIFQIFFPPTKQITALAWSSSTIINIINKLKTNTSSELMNQYKQTKFTDFYGDNKKIVIKLSQIQLFNSHWSL